MRGDRVEIEFKVKIQRTVFNVEYFIPKGTIVDSVFPYQKPQSKSFNIK